MQPSRIQVLLALLVFAPSTLAQDAEQARDASVLLQRSGPAPQYPPAPATSSPGTVTPYFTNIATSPTSDVPGLVGTKFTSGAITTAFEHQWFSADGVHYVFRGDTPLATTMDAVVIRNGALLWQEGTTAPFMPLELWGVGDNRMGINNSGDLALTHNSSATTNDDYVLSWNAGSGVYTVLAQEAGTISFLPPTVTWDDTMDSVSLLNDGRVMWRAVGIDGTGITVSVNDEILVLGTAVHTRTGVDIPAGQAGGAMNTWENFTIDNVWVSPDGLHVLIDGDTNALTGVDEVLTYDGTVVIQEGSVLPGTGYVSPVAAASPTEVRMDHAGNWYARGDNVNANEDWVLRNGVLIAATDTPISVNDERVFMTTTINEAQETPPTGSVATGVGTFLVDTASNQLWYDITLTGLAGESAAHIHGFAAPGVPAGILYVLPLGATKNGVITYLESEEAGILAGLTYVNIHTATFGAGEIRGQILVGQEQWDDTDFAECFFDHTGNASGSFLVAGVTNAPSSVNGVVVLNGTTVILREGDPIDIDGNGLFDDDAFVQNLGDDDFTLLDDGSMAFFCTLRNSAGTAFAAGIFKRSAGNHQRAVCFGDGSGTACPCGNNSVVGQMAGCVSSIGLAGRIDSIGIASIAADTLVLQGSEVPNGPGLYFRGSGLFPGPGLSFGDGLLCAGGTIIRMGVVFASGNVSSYPGGTTPAPIHLAGLSSSGDTHYYQLWYRDADLSYCVAGSAFNLTNAVEVLWAP